MPFFLLLCTLLRSPVDNYCRENYGHDGDLGVTKAAAEHFTCKTTYKEAVATIGEMGQELSGKKSNRSIYRWQNGALEMQFLGDKLIEYRLNGELKVFAIPVIDLREQQRDAREQQQQGAKIDQESLDHDRRKEYEEFQRKIEGIIQAGGQVTDSDLERSDIHALQFLLHDLNKAVAAGDWKDAEEIRNKMSVSLQRGQSVAADAPRRLTERQRADEERRHNEEMRQRERQHEEEMSKQQEILNEIRLRRLQGH
jgi:hypothetical protein